MSRTFAPVLIAVFAVVCAWPAAAQEESKPAAKTITFTKKAPVAGDFYGSMEKTESSNTTSMTRNGEATEPRTSKNSSTINREVTIMAAKDGKVTKAKVTYKKVEMVRPERAGRGGGRRGGRGGQGGGEPRAQLSDIAGQTFILDFSAETPKVTDDKGEAVAKNISSLLLRRESKDGKFTGWGNDMIAVLGKNKVAVGEVIALDQKRFAMLGAGNRGARRMRGGRRGGRGGRGGNRGGAEATERPVTMKASMTLKGTKKVFGVECAEFEVKATDNSSTDNERMTSDRKMKMVGTVLIGVDNGWLYSAKMEGTNSSSMSGSMRDTEFERESAGSNKATKTIIYSKKKTEQ